MAKQHGYGQKCSQCDKPIGPLHPAVPIPVLMTGITQEVWRHAQPCPTPARPTGERAFPYLPAFPPLGPTWQSRF